MPDDDKPNDRPPVLRDRSPRPYTLQDYTLSKDHNARSNSSGALTPPRFDLDTSPKTPSFSRRSSAPDHEGSESGTEADDERPQLLRALPPATIRSHKGLKHSDGSASPLLTPTQLDWQGRILSKEYIDERRRSRRAKEEDEHKLAQERRKFEIRRTAERIRRLSEAALLGAIGLAVVCGSRIWHLHWQWYLLEVLSQVSAIAGLIAFYPLRLVSVEADRGHVHIWSRFRIPPSFDPATVLYPTFLPVLVSLSLVRQLPELFLPSAILGLASLPPRLFPEWAKQSDINALHWVVSLAPVVTSRGLGHLSRRFPAHLTVIQPPDAALGPSTKSLLLLFPLHQALIPSIHYLTTTSLLPAEKQLLSTALVSVLFFTHSPQISILRSVLWAGGVPILILCTRVLQWNVALARVPTWRLRDFRRSGRQGSVLGDVLNEALSSIRKLLGKAPSTILHESESDDEPSSHVKSRQSRAPSLITTLTFQQKSPDSFSAVDKSPDHLKPWETTERRDSKASGMKRRATISSPMLASFDADVKSPITVRKPRNRKRDWTFNLTAFQATFRKRFFAAYIYCAIIMIVLFPIRMTISEYALSGQEPIFWILSYLLSGLPYPRTALAYLRTHPLRTAFDALQFIIPSNPTIPNLRATLTPPNTRLALIAYFLLVLLLGLALVLTLSPTIEVDTRRKIFHAIMVLMFLPTLYIDPCFCALALSAVLALFLLLEVIRAGQVPPLGTAIGRFVAPYVDGRDLRGPMVVSHVFLLIGCAIPFWLSLAAFERAGEGTETGWELVGDKRETAMVSGVVCVGMGDAAASLIGRRFGRRKWPWIGGKSLEGSAAFAAAVTVGLSLGKIWLRVGGWRDVNAGEGGLGEAMVFLLKAWTAGCGASFMEAVLTGANDNVVVPVALWLLCRGLRV
ncbi:hypothetical protein CAC42_5989 [Sphaceloma murrayae]|uniref:dolichol kinase n=1 Tax=Sphaceloma murrayae TaxID=2082308 RepID=A0A2K1QZS2_9PEZI|nr:hypothetical protein CAC42_5989 [Sphaceloma murrayae]